MDSVQSMFMQNAGVILFSSLAMANMMLGSKSSRVLIAAKVLRISRSAADRDSIIKNWQEKDGLDSG